MVLFYSSAWQNYISEVKGSSQQIIFACLKKKIREFLLLRFFTKLRIFANFNFSFVAPLL